MQPNIAIRWLDPTGVVVERLPGSVVVRIRLPNGEVYEDVQFARAFPLSHPQGYISVLHRQERDKWVEIGMFRTLEGMPEASRRLVEEELERRYFTPVIEKIYALEEEYGQHRWEVETDRGRRVFYVSNWRENIHELSPARYLIVAVDGSRYEIRDLNALDRRSRALLENLY
ncbi:MAG: DUF1854 domain-containing protein [Fimbriimonadales bacterium]|nr:DUF1854 domain-containing protein [Fimbriimonadales bacterium]MDW8051344.1 DUF1854 domain-containing protein [Armatimonadota bacterium]